MASSKTYLAFVLEQCSNLSARAMMGEYILYFGGKVIGGIYDDRLLVKPTPAAKALMPQARQESPYEGGKAMLLVENTEDRVFLQTLFSAVCNDLPEITR